MARHRFGPLRVLEIEGRTALLWVGYDLGLDTLALDMMHADFDLVTGLLGRPGAVHMAGVGCLGGRGSAADVVLGYPDAIARCASSSLMPRPYGVRGGWRATFTGVVLEYAMRAGSPARAWPPSPNTPLKVRTSSACRRPAGPARR